VHRSPSRVYKCALRDLTGGFRQIPAHANRVCISAPFGNRGGSVFDLPPCRGMQRGHAAGPLAKWRGITTHISQLRYYPFFPNLGLRLLTRRCNLFLRCLNRRAPVGQSRNRESGIGLWPMLCLFRFRGAAPLPCRAFTPLRPADTGNPASLSAALVSAPVLVLALAVLASVPATRRLPVSASYRPPPATSAAPASRPQADRAKGHSPGANLRFQPCLPLQSRTLQNAASLHFASCPPVATARKPFQSPQYLGQAYPVRRSPWKAYRCRYAGVACYGASLSVWPLLRLKLSSWCKVDCCVSLQL